MAICVTVLDVLILMLWSKVIQGSVKCATNIIRVMKLSCACYKTKSQGGGPLGWFLIIWHRHRFSQMWEAGCVWGRLTISVTGQKNEIIIIILIDDWCRCSTVQCTYKLQTIIPSFPRLIKLSPWELTTWHTPDHQYPGWHLDFSYAAGSVR